MTKTHKLLKRHEWPPAWLKEEKKEESWKPSGVGFPKKGKGK